MRDATFAYGVVGDAARYAECAVAGAAAGAAQLYAGLKDQGILVRHFDTPRLRDHLRISVGTPAQNDALLTALLAML